MNIWAIGKDGKPLTAGQIRRSTYDFKNATCDDEVICAVNKKSIKEWIENWQLTDCEPVKIWSGK
jgi:hypothetical protein